METLTVVVEGALAHEDRWGSKPILRAGDVQRISAGRGPMDDRKPAPRHGLPVET